MPIFAKEIHLLRKFYVPQRGGILVLTSLLWLRILPSVADVTCIVDSLQLTPPSQAINISDKPIGSVLATVSMSSKISCTGTGWVPITAAYFNIKAGYTPQGNGPAPTNNTAIGFYILQPGSSDYSTGKIDTERHGFWEIRGNASYGTSGYTHTERFTTQWQLVKLAEPQRGSFSVSTPSMTIQGTTNRDDYSADIPSTSNNIIPEQTVSFVNIPKCTIATPMGKNFTVPEAQTSQLHSNSARSGPFSIDLVNCGENRHFDLTFSGDAADAEDGLLRATGAADVGIQLLHDDGTTPAKLNSPIRYTTSDGPMSLNFRARLKATGSNPAPGNVQSIVNFDLTYVD